MVYKEGGAGKEDLGMPWRRMPLAAGVLITVFSMSSSLALEVRADRGMIPFKPEVKLYEPRQDAAIAWNGKQEILLLSTDLHASEDTKVLEVLPLPSEPKVEEGSNLFFTVADQVIKQKQAVPKKKNGGGLKAKDVTRAAEPEPAGLVTQHEIIGAHDISVTEVLSAEGFVEWVTTYLQGQGVDTPEVPEPMKTAIGKYLNKKFKWFVFDVVSLKTSTTTHDAIMYTFASKRLYYPLHVMQTLEGKTSARLLILTNKLLATFEGFPQKSIKVEGKPVTTKKGDFLSMTSVIRGKVKKSADVKGGLADFLVPAQLQKLAACIGAMFDLLGGEEKKVKLRVWRIEGSAATFKKDLLVK
jgi:hypothetical protein